MLGAETIRQRRSIAETKLELAFVEFAARAIEPNRCLEPVR
ncbi:hypothetical protein [Tychonema bourrellyi]|nr:hypothetical protein [Tychonema bourrellyi]